jgi:RNA polymerase sigma-70 factor (ECF subfamily)
VIAAVLDLDLHLPGIQRGDTAVFGRWLGGAEPALRRALAPLGAQVDVEAVLQETLLRVWQVAPRCLPDGAPNALLRLASRIARNLALDELRRSRARPEEAETLERALFEAAWRSEPHPPDPLLRARVVECEQELPARPRQALAARLGAAGAEPDAVLAERLGMRTNTFLQNLSRARRLLLDCLRRSGVDLEEVLP